MPARLESRTSPSAAMALVLLLGAVVWGSTASFEFSLDDRGIVYANEQVDRGDFGAMLTTSLRAGSTVEEEVDFQEFLYRPVPKISFALNRLVSGDRPWSFHLANALLHFLAAGLAWILLRRLGTPQPVAVLAIAFFLLHPIHCEAVANVKHREEILAAIGLLGAWIAVERAFGGRWFWTLAAGAFFLFGLLSKESALAALVLIPLADLAFHTVRERPWAKRFRVYSGLAAAFAAWLLLRVAVIGLSATRGLEVFFLPDEGLWTRLLTSAKVWAEYYVGRGFFLLSCPIGFSSRCEVLVERGWPSSVALLGLLILLVSIAWAGWYWRRGRRDAAFWVGFFWIALLPTSNLFVPIGTVGAFRLLYVPTLAWGVLLGWGGWWLARRLLPESKRTVAFSAGVCVLAGIWSAASFLENRNWKDDTAVNRSDLRRTSNPRARYIEAMNSTSPADKDRWLREVVRIMESVPGSARGMETTLLARSYNELAEMALGRGELGQADGFAARAVAVLEVDARYRKYLVFPLSVRARIAAARGDRQTDPAPALDRGPGSP